MKLLILFAFTLACVVPVSLVAQQDERHTTGNVPIEFYGKVIDQDGNPLASAKVAFELQVGHMTSETKGYVSRNRITLQTDQSGQFSINGTKGIHLILQSVEEPGCELSKKTERWFSYNESGAIFHPDPSKPVIFKMWKKAGKEPLVGSHWRGKVVCDSTLVSFGLLNGKPSQDGDLQIVCTLTPTDKKVGNHTLSDYGFQITIVGGGVQQTGDEFTYLAPENGYLPTVTIHEEAADANHRNPELEQEFYIKTADGHYGRLSIDWSAWQKPPTYFEWDCSINPSGSRNLER
jgi:hypothetical protein